MKYNFSNLYDNPGKLPSHNLKEAIKFCGHMVLLTILQRFIFLDVEVNSMGHIVNHCNGLTDLHKTTRAMRQTQSSQYEFHVLINACVTRLHCIYMLYMLMYVNHCMCHNIAFFIYIIFVNQCMFHKIAF